MRLIGVRLVLVLLAGALAAVAPGSAAAASAPSVTVSALSSLATVSGLACPASGACLAVGTDTAGNSAVEAISAGRPGPVTDLPDSSFTPLAVACPQTGRCLVAGDALDPTSAAQVGALVTVTGSAAGATEPVSGTTSLTALSCASATVCTAIAQMADGSAGTVAIDNDQPGAAGESASPSFTPTAIGCPPTGDCQLAGTLLTSTGTSGAVSSGDGPANLVAGATELAGIACPTSGSCVAVGSAPGPTDADGNPLGAPYLVAVSGGQPGGGAEPEAPAGSELTAVACAPDAECVAVGDDPGGDTLVQSVAAGRPSALVTVPADATLGPVQLGAMACPSSTECLATGQDANGDPVLAQITLPGSAGGTGTSGGTGTGSGTGAPGAGPGTGPGGGAGSPGHRHAGRRATIATRLRLSISWRRTVHLTAITVILREQRAGDGAGVDGASVLLQLRPARPGGRWRTVASGRTGRRDGETGVAHLRLAVRAGERVVLRGTAARDGADAAARSLALGLVVT